MGTTSEEIPLASRQASSTSCGVRVASTAQSDVGAAVEEIRRDLGAAAIQHLVVFFSLEHDPGQLAAALGSAFPGVPVSGCSTAGEITPSGMMKGGIVAIAFPHEGFRIHADLIANVDAFGIEGAAHIVRKLKAQMAERIAGRLGEKVFALMLVDGLSNAEERLVASVHWAIDDVQLIGGSAGDGLTFSRTSLLHNGRAVTRASILIMVETDFPFRVFKTQNFAPTEIKLVVTAADSENRIVHELNAEPAAHEYAAAIGLMPDELGPFSFASYPLVVKVGGDYYCRSIRNMNPDGSLSFFCAIDEGLVFTVARPQDMLRSTSETLESIDAALGGIDFVIGFDCILRRLDAETRQIRHEVDALYRKYSVVGFHTYGEQFNAMHLNQTLTGIAFGHKGAPPAKRA